MIFVLFMFILRPAGFWRPYWGHWALCLGISQFQPWRLYSQQIEGGIIRSPLILIPSPFQSRSMKTCSKFRRVVSKILRLSVSLPAYSVLVVCLPSFEITEAQPKFRSNQQLFHPNFHSPYCRILWNSHVDQFIDASQKKIPLETSLQLVH